jgi:hypothetical protein
MAENIFSIAKDFSPFAGPRYAHQGSHSGESLRSKLVRFLNTHPGRVIVVLDGTKGMGSSFLDEAFGGLIRNEGWAKHDVEQRLKFQSQLDPSYIKTIHDSLERAAIHGNN